jgi:hypothetical protein
MLGPSWFLNREWSMVNGELVRYGLLSRLAIKRLFFREIPETGPDEVRPTLSTLSTC